jgi:hypothetical protein
VKPALSQIGHDLIRALAGLAARPAIDRAVRARAEALAREATAAGGRTARVVREGPGEYVVTTNQDG